MTQNNADLACSLLLEGVDMNQLQALAAQRGAGGAGDPNAAYPDYGDEDAGYGADPMAGMMGGAGAGQA